MPKTRTSKASQPIDTTGKREIRVLTIHQPFADEILYGDKWCENRTWETKYRGELFIHANKWNRYEPAGESPGKGVIGAIIGKVTLADCFPVTSIHKYRNNYYGRPDKQHRIPAELEAIHQFSESEQWSEESFRHVCGEFCFIFTNAEPLPKPIPAKGKLNIWRHWIPETIDA